MEGWGWEHWVGRVLLQQSHGGRLALIPGSPLQQWWCQGGLEHPKAGLGSGARLTTYSREPCSF